MNKKIVLIITVIVSLCMCFCSPKPIEKMYVDAETQSFVCAQNDSLFIYHKTSDSYNSSYYYGAFKRVGDTLLLFDNLLKSSNALIDTEYTDYNGTEIQLQELYYNIVCGGDAEDSLYYRISQNSDLCWNYDKDYPCGWRLPDLETKDGIIKIPAETNLSDQDNCVELLIRGYNFYTEQCLELKPHTRYLIKQKSKRKQPLVPKEYLFLNDDKNQTITISVVPMNGFGSEPDDYKPKKSMVLKRSYGEKRQLSPKKLLFE